MYAISALARSALIPLSRTHWLSVEQHRARAALAFAAAILAAGEAKVVA